MEKSEASPLSRTPSVGKEGLGEGRTALHSPHLTYLGGREVAGSYLPSCIWFPISSRAVAR